MYVPPFFVFLCLLVKCFTCEPTTASPLEDFDGYFWRDYNNRIPKDAFLANVGLEYDSSTYIAQVLYKNLLIPGVIEPLLSTDAIYVYGNEELKSSTNVKILCADNQNLLEWEKTNTDDFFMSKDYVVGGYENGNKVFIGRAWRYENLFVGKVIVHDSVPVFLHTTKSGEVIRLRNFQVLRVARRTGSTEAPDYQVTTDNAPSETDPPRMSTEFSHTGTPFPFYPIETRFHRFPPPSPRPYYIRGDYSNIMKTTRSWIAERFNPSTSRPRFYQKEDSSEQGLSISPKRKTVTFKENEKCTCSKGTVIINFN